MIKFRRNNSSGMVEVAENIQKGTVVKLEPTTSPMEIDNHRILIDFSCNKRKLKVISAHLFDKCDPNADEIDLSNESIEKIEPYAFAKFTKLKYLWMNKTQVIRLDSETFVGLVNLRELVVNETPLSEISWADFYDFAQLRELDLSLNKLVTINSDMFVSLISLERLRIAMNEIKSVSAFAFAGLRNLKTLDLMGNNLTHIKPCHFKGLENLQVLDLSYNLIEKIDANAFVELKKLEQLYIKSNFLSKVNPIWFDSLDETRVGCVDISENPFVNRFASFYDVTVFYPNEYLEYSGLTHEEIVNEMANNSGILTKWSDFRLQFENSFNF